MQRFFAVTALFVTIAVGHPETQPLPTFSGIVCPTRADAEQVARVSARYDAVPNMERRTHCTVIIDFHGREVGETRDFNIGNHIYSFRIINVDGYDVYLLNDKGEGWVA